MSVIAFFEKIQVAVADHPAIERSHGFGMGHPEPLKDLLRIVDDYRVYADVHGRIAQEVGVPEPQRLVDVC